MLQSQEKAKSITSTQGFFLRKKYTKRNYDSMNIRKNQNFTSQGTRQIEGKYHKIDIASKQQTPPLRNTTSMYIQNKAYATNIQKKQQNSNTNKSSDNFLSQKASFHQSNKPYMRLHKNKKLIEEQKSQQISQQNPREFSKSAHRYRYKKVHMSLHKQSKGNISMAGGTMGNLIQDYRRKNQRDLIMSRINADTKKSRNLLIFLAKVQELQVQFVKNSIQEEYEKAIEVIIRLLNYSVDLNLVQPFSISLKVMADFYLHTGCVNQALFYYNQTRESALLLQQAVLLIESLIGIAKCCSKGNLQNQSIIILKKALEYAWFYDKKELQLQLYDQIGQKYYHLGEIATAKKYHLRYINSIYQPADSAHKSLSKQRIKKSEQLNIQIKYQQLSILFLVHLKIPIKSFEQIPPLVRTSIDVQTGQKQQERNNVRDSFNISKKYFSHFQDMEKWINTIMKGWFFAEEMDQPPLPNEDWTTPVKMKKFAYIDFKMNQHLKRFNPKIQLSQQNAQPASSSEIKFKQTLDEKIQRKLKEPQMEEMWYEKMVQQIVRDHKNKLLNVRNAVRMRGYNKPSKPQIQTLKQIYNKFFERKKD